MESFDIARNPLAPGTCLIEAGAGTGKTYALTAVFLRLLVEKAIPPDRILVVTFTKAATAELRDRLRRQLVAVRRYVEGEDRLDDTLRELVVRAGPPPRVHAAVMAALREFDRIAVFTIHGFCHRLLGELAFEAGSPFEVELLADPEDWVRSAAEDYWRKTLFAAEPELVDHAVDRLKGPEHLAALYRRYRLPDLRVVPAMPELPHIDLAPYRRRRAFLKREWPAARSAAAARLESPALKANIYGALKSPRGAGPRRTPRGQKIEAWCQALDHWLLVETPLFRDCPPMVYFAADKIAASTRKGQVVPQHPFFDAVQSFRDAAEALRGDMDRWLIAMRYGFLRYADRRLEHRKEDNQTLFYDDLLARLWQALTGTGGERLVAEVRRRYQAALVDEFQDTDPVQYQIFHRLFHAPDHWLLMIGDPKQAIYGFRGADIFSYLQAARQADRCFTLTQNWRASPELIAAVNTLFQNRVPPFLIPEIGYHPACAAPRSPAAQDGADCGPPMTFWLLGADAGDTRRDACSPNKQQASASILAALASEVGQLIARGGANHVPHPGWAPRDIAVLVRTNRQARMVKECLQDAGIPAVIQNAGNVFGTPEAAALEHVLRAVADPGDVCKLKTALATRLFALPGDRLADGDPAEGRWDAERLHFFRHHAVWLAEGFFPFFRRMLTVHRIPERLLALTDGERRLTNLLHLGELLHRASVHTRPGLRGLLQWLAVQRRLLAADREEQQLRMESDAEALTIMTIHKSKGLEFPIVFHPFSWESDADRGSTILFHDPQADMRRTLDISGDARAAHRELARRERLAEALRLLYVAVTRAKQRCYLVWGALPGAAQSALGYLLASGTFANQSPESGAAGRPMSDPTEAPGEAVYRLVHQARDAIAAADLPPPGDVATTRDAPRNPTGGARRLARKLNRHWQIASFSSLIRGSEKTWLDPADRDQGAGTPLPAEDDSSPTDDRQTLQDNLHLFPRGAQAGNFFHRLFELLDFSAIRPQGLEALVAAELIQNGFDRQWTRPVARMVNRTLDTPLPDVAPAFRLRQLAPCDRVTEMPFAFPLHRLKAEALGSVFARHDMPLAHREVGRQLAKLQFTISGGFLRGFIDLVFRAAGRYFLLDWKSNHLGDVYGDYGRTRLKTIMTDDYYFLQYHLYSLALDKYLRLRLPEYLYERDFGGVYYLFVRGLQPATGDDHGVFYDRPRAALIDDLGALLSPP